MESCSEHGPGVANCVYSAAVHKPKAKMLLASDQISYQTKASNRISPLPRQGKRRPLPQCFRLGHHPPLNVSRLLIGGWGGVFPVVLHNFREIRFVACRARVLQIQPSGDADCVVYMGALLVG